MLSSNYRRIQLRDYQFCTQQNETNFALAPKH